MKINLNGEEKLTKALNIYELLQELEMVKDGVVILKNDEVIKKIDWGKSNLIDKDSVEVLYFVSGG